MNLAGGELRGVATRNRPGAAFVFADGEERNVAEQIVAGANDAIEPRFGEAEIGEKRRGVGRLELGDFELDLGADGDRGGGGAGEKRREAGRVGGLARVAPAASPASSRLRTISSGLAERNWKPRSRLRSSPCKIERAERTSVFERRAAERHDVALAFEIGRPALLQILLEPFEPPFGDAEVREDQLVFHRLRVASRVDRPGRMRHRRIRERPQHVDERVGVLVRGDIDERLRRAGPDRRRHVRELDGRRHALLGVVHRGQAIEALVRHLRNADGRLALSGRRPRGVGHELEKGGLAGLTESDEGRPQHGWSRILTRAKAVASRGSLLAYRPRGD